MKVPRKDFETFKNECRKWQNRLSLLDWNLFFQFKRLDENRAAQLDVCYRNCTATLSLTSEIDESNWGEANPKDCAKHEMLHLLLARLEGMAQERFLTLDEIQNEWERLVLILEKVIK